MAPGALKTFSGNAQAPITSESLERISPDLNYRSFIKLPRFRDNCIYKFCTNLQFLEGFMPHAHMKDRTKFRAKKSMDKFYPYRRFCVSKK